MDNIVSSRVGSAKMLDNRRRCQHIQMLRLMQPSDSIRVYLKDINNVEELADDLSILCSAVPRIGDVINVFEILPEEDRQESGWWYAVEGME